MKLWLEVDGIQAAVSLPATLRDELEELHAQHKLGNVLPRVPIVGRLAAEVEGALLKSCDESTNGLPQLAVVLFGKPNGDRVVAYFLGQDPASVLSSMQQQGWQVLGRRDAPRPFAACKRTRIVVCHDEELLVLKS